MTDSPVNTTPWCGEDDEEPGPQVPTTQSAQPSIVVARRAIARAPCRGPRQIADLKQRADTDILLDIQNRRGFERELRRSLAYVKRYRATAAPLYPTSTGRSRSTIAMVMLRAMPH